jgi:hypothetical protein
VFTSEILQATLTTHPLPTGVTLEKETNEATAETKAAGNVFYYAEADSSFLSCSSCWQV